jgi:O-glycosyl hydrolase
MLDAVRDVRTAVLLGVALGALLPTWAVSCGERGHSRGHKGDGKAAGNAKTGGPVRVVVDGARPDQVWEGFGTTDLFGFDGLEVEPEAGKPGKIPEAGRKELLRLYYQEMGMTRVRFFPVGYEPVNDNDDPAVTNWAAFKWDFRGNRFKSGLDMFYLDHVKMGAPFRDPNEPFTIFPANHWWERWMGCKPFDPKMVDEYAEHAYAAVQHWKKKYGFEMPYWSLFNEPSNNARLSIETAVALTLAVGRRFRKAGFKTKITAMDQVSVRGRGSMAAIEAILKHEEARQYIGAVSYHRYGTHGSVPNMLRFADQGRRMLRGPVPCFGLARKHGKSVWLTEICSGKLGGYTYYDVGRARATHIAEEINNGRVNAFDFMLPYFVERKKYAGEAFIYLRFKDRAFQRAEIDPKGDWFALFSRYIRPGARRLPSESSNGLVVPTCFHHQANGTVTLVVINNSAAPAKVEMEIKGVVVRQCRLRVRTSPTARRNKLPPAAVKDGKFADELPKHSITTYVLATEAAPQGR